MQMLKALGPFSLSVLEMQLSLMLLKEVVSGEA